MGPNVPVPRFLLLPGLARFRPFSPVLAVITGFAWGISPYPGHPTWYLRRGQVTCYHPSRITAQHLAIS